jgi:Rho GTPase-activating protein RGD1
VELIRTRAELLFVDLDAVDLDSNEWTSDINIVASVLKQWLRELPDPLMTNRLRPKFIEAASPSLSSSFSYPY